MDEFKKQNNYEWNTREELRDTYISKSKEYKRKCKQAFRQTARSRMKSSLIKERGNF